MNDEMMLDEATDSVSEEDIELLREIGESGEPDDASVEAEAETDAAAEPDAAAEYLAKIGELEEKLRLAQAERAERERELECLGLLGDAGLPTELKDAVMASADMAGTVELIGQAVAKCVEAEVSKRCRTDAPSTGSHAPLTKDELMRMPVAELQRLRDSGFAL